GRATRRIGEAVAPRSGSKRRRAIPRRSTAADSVARLSVRAAALPDRAGRESRVARQLGGRRRARHRTMGLLSVLEACTAGALDAGTGRRQDETVADPWW